MTFIFFPGLQPLVWLTFPLNPFTFCLQLDPSPAGVQGRFSLSAGTGTRSSPWHRIGSNSRTRHLQHSGKHTAPFRLKTNSSGSLSSELQNILQGDKGLQKLLLVVPSATINGLSHDPNIKLIKKPLKYLCPSALVAFPTWTPGSCCCSSRFFHQLFCTLSTRRRRRRPARPGRRRWPPAGGSWARWGGPCLAALLAQGEKEQGGTHSKWRCRAWETTPSTLLTRITNIRPVEINRRICFPS